MIFPHTKSQSGIVVFEKHTQLFFGSFFLIEATRDIYNFNDKEHGNSFFHVISKHFYILPISISSGTHVLAGSLLPGSEMWIDVDQTPLSSALLALYKRFLKSLLSSNV